MDLERAYNVLVELAKKQNISVEKVINEIEETIKEAYESCDAREDKKALRMWAEIPHKGKLPTAVEMVAYLGEITVRAGAERNNCFGNGRQISEKTPKS